MQIFSFGFPAENLKEYGRVRQGNIFIGILDLFLTRNRMVKVLGPESDPLWIILGVMG
jgi:hypothetical protein